MAEDPEDVEKDEAEESDSPEAQAKKKKIMLGGGVAAVVATGAIAAMMAMPSADVKPILEGPFTFPLFEEQFHCNIQVQGRTRFLQMTPDVFYYAYDKGYVASRSLDELYGPSVRDKVFRVSTSTSLDGIYGEVGKSTFMEELRDALDPIIFPVHIGDTSLPLDIDDESGLRPGVSSDQNTFRGHFHDHVLHVDAAKRTLKIDDGPEVTFEEDDPNVKVLSTDGAVLYIDTTPVDPEFVGEIPVGIKGKIRQVLPTGLMVQ